MDIKKYDEAHIMTTMTNEQALLELNLLQADADSTNSTDLYIWLQNTGLPPEVASKLHDLISTTKVIAGEVISIGKMIILKIIEFIKQNQNMAIGTAIGAVVATLLGAIPFLGPILAPIAMALGMVAGLRADQRTAGEEAAIDYKIVSVTQDIIEIARTFLTLLIEIFQIIFKGSDGP